MAINTATGFINYLVGKGIQPQAGEKYPLFSTRAKIFQQVGLGNEADFRGTTDQNTATLNYLMRAEKNTGVPITKENLWNVISASKSPLQQTSNTWGGGYNVPTQPTPGVGVKNPNYNQNVPDVPDLPPGATREIQRGIPSEPVYGADGKTIIGWRARPELLEPTPEDIQSALPQTPDAGTLAQQALEQVMGGAKFPLQKESSEAEKAALQLQGQRDKEELISTLASRGLFFSGKKTTGVQQIEADTLAKQLGVDRKFALLIATGLESAAQDIAKEAQAGRKEAIDALDALGFAINPITGRIEPTLAARKAVSAEEQFAEREARFTEQFATREEQFATREERLTEQFTTQQELRDAQFELSQAKSAAQIDQAQQRIDIALERLELAKEKETGAGFTNTQLNQGSAASGKTIEEFRALPQDEQNKYINGELKDLVGGRLPEDKMKDKKKFIDEELESVSTSSGDLIKEVNDSSLPQADKDELIQHIKNNSEGFWNFIRRLAP